jgi:hypothetical protein
MERTIGMERGFSARADADEALRRLVDLGATSVETYVRWSDIEPAAGRLDWSLFDRDLDALQRHGLRWVPFFIAGPWYATPPWFRHGPRSVPARCLEHDRATGAQSIWNPHLFPEVQRLLEACATHYRGAAVESLLLGVSGDYGEAIYTVTGNWPGDYHGHAGYWCGDPHAMADFRRWVQTRYGDLVALRQAWGAAPAAWEDLRPPTSPAAAPGRRAWLDFITWYREAMSDWSQRWLTAAAAAWPGVERYLCTGGDMLPAHGSDFSEQCRIAAAAGAGVRITNEGSDFVQNLLLTRLVACAGQWHGAFYGFEPAAVVTPRGVAARQFNACSAGARQLHEYAGNLAARPDAAAEAGAGDAATVWAQGLPLLRQRRPRWQVALLHSLPDLAWREAGLLAAALPLARSLRPVCDFAVLDDHLVAAGALDGLRAVFLAPCRLWAADTAERVAAFVAAGGICVAAGIRPEPWETGGADVLGPLFGFGQDTEECIGISAVRAVATAPLDTYRRLPTQHIGRSFLGLLPDVEPLLEVTHLPEHGRRPTVLWLRRQGRGAAVFYAGSLTPAEDWMAQGDRAQALVRDLLATLPAALGLSPVPTAAPSPVWEATLADGTTLGWNIGDHPVAWRGRTLAPGAIGEGIPPLGSA